MITRPLTLKEVIVDNQLVRNIEAVAKVEGGFMKDFIIRCLVAQDQPWWNKTSSEWKITSNHPWCKENEYSPTYWEDRVIELCTYDITQANFGMTFSDLMELDVATFEKIEERVHKIAERQAASIPQEMKDKYEKANGMNPSGIQKPNFVRR